MEEVEEEEEERVWNRREMRMLFEWDKRRRRNGSWTAEREERESMQSSLTNNSSSCVHPEPKDTAIWIKASITPQNACVWAKTAGDECSCARTNVQSGRRSRYSARIISQTGSEKEKARQALCCGGSHGDERQSWSGQPSSVGSLVRLLMLSWLLLGSLWNWIWIESEHEMQFKWCFHMSD